MRNKNFMNNQIVQINNKKYLKKNLKKTQKIW